MLPFTAEVFFRVVAQYNVAIWPAQLVAIALGALVVLLALRPRPGGDRIAAAVLAGVWLWVGVVYHAMHLATVNLAAWPFGALFVVQGLLFAWTGALRGRLAFRFAPGLYGWVGLGFVVLALAAYPLAGVLAGRGWAEALVFGVAPGPTTLFTLGLLVPAEPRAPLHLTVVPVLWSLIGGATAWLLGVPGDLVLTPAGLAALWLMARRNRRARAQD